MTTMASTTIVFGVLLTLLGLGGYFLTGTSSVTALIPAIFGLLLLVLGFLARSEAVRKHAMHAAAAVALVGCAGALFSLARTPTGPRSPMAVFSQAAMVVLTAVFVGLCVRSFIDARRARAGKP
jgi:O-antigen/teichoic acid export membrane protein